MKFIKENIVPIVAVLFVSLVVMTAVYAIRFTNGKNPIQPSDAYTRAGFGGSIHTITHDGHRFVVLTRDRGTALLHHPDCCKPQ